MLADTVLPYKPSIVSLNTPQNDETALSGTDDAVKELILYTEEAGGLEDPISITSSSSRRKHTDRVAVIIEDRPLGNLAPILRQYPHLLIYTLNKYQPSYIRGIRPPKRRVVCEALSYFQSYRQPRKIPNHGSHNFLFLCQVTDLSIASTLSFCSRARMAYHPIHHAAYSLDPPGLVIARARRIRRNHRDPPPTCRDLLLLARLSLGIPHLPLHLD